MQKNIGFGIVQLDYELKRVWKLLSIALVAGSCFVWTSFGSVDFLTASAAPVQDIFGEDEEESVEESTEEDAMPEEKPVKISPRLVRNWQIRLPVGTGHLQRFPVRVIIPKSSHPAFQIKPDAPASEIPANLELVISLKTKAGTKRISSKQIGPNGKPLGVEGARGFAEIHSDLLKSRGLEVTQKAQLLPSAVAYSVTDTGSVRAVDAETGKTIWSRSASGIRGPVLGFGVTDRYLAYVKGTEVVVYNSVDGDEIQRHKLRIVPAAAPVMNDRTVVLVDGRGVIESLKIDNKDHIQTSLGGYGGGFTQEISNVGRSFIWGSRKEMFMSSVTNPTYPLFRIPCNPRKFSKPEGFGELVVFSSDEGKLSCFTQGSGRLMWDEYFDNQILDRPFMVELQKSEIPESQLIKSLVDELKPQEEKPKSDSGGDEEESEEDVFGDSNSEEDDTFGGFGGDEEESDDDIDEEDGEGRPSVGKSVRSRDKLDIDQLIGSNKVVRVLVIENGGTLKAVDMKSGQRVPGFSASGIKKVLGFNSSFIVAQSTNGDIVSLDLVTGRILSRYPLYGNWTGFVNKNSDRIYLRNNSGQILCLRPEGNQIPVYQKPKQLEKLKTKKPKKKDEEEVEEDEDDIFG